MLLWQLLQLPRGLLWQLLQWLLLLWRLRLRLRLLRLLQLRRRRALGNRCPHVTPLPQLAEVRLPALRARAAASRQVEAALGGHTLAQPAPVRVAVLQRAG